MSFEGWLAYFRSLGSGRRVHLVGHSLGGAIAVHLAREPWVASVTLIAPATRAYCESRRIASRSGRDPGSIVFESPLNRLVAWRDISREDAEVLREDYAKAGPLLSRGVPWPPYPMDEAEYLSGKPVLLVYGEEDAVIPTFYFRRLGEDLLAEGVCVTTVCLPGVRPHPTAGRAMGPGAGSQFFLGTTGSFRVRLGLLGRGGLGFPAIPG